MRFLLGDAEAGQEIDDGFGLDLEFAGQFVNPDLVYISHALSG